MSRLLATTSFVLLIWCYTPRGAFVEVDESVLVADGGYTAW